MVPLINIERGTVIADRYVVSEVRRPWLAEFPEAGTVCLVIDAILDEPAQLFAADASRSGDLLDAARRASLLTDPRIPDIHDVGRADGIDFVVVDRTEAVGLPALLGHGPLDPEAARALVGEAATALVHASKRGLHHLCLGPESIALTPTGEVEVQGVAIDAAVADGPYELGLDALSSREALREDALALVNILYATLTAHWPGPEARSGLEPAPKKNALIVRAESVTPGIPRDLEEFVSGVVSKTEAGPRSPSEIVRYLGEWDTRALHRLARGGTAEPGEPLFPGGTTDFSGTPRDSAPGSTADAAKRAPGQAPGAESPAGRLPDTAGPAGTGAAAAAAAAAGTTAGSTPSLPERGTPAGTSAGGRSGSRPSRTPVATPAPAAEESAPTRRATPQQLQAALKRIGMVRPGTTGLAAGRSGSETSPFDDQMQMRRASTFPVAAASMDEVADDTREWQPEDTFSSYSEYASREQDPNLTAPILDRDAMWNDSEDTQVIELDRAPDPEGSGEDEDDGSWFLGGMFTTREEELARQRAEFERERRLQQEAEERLRLSDPNRRTSRGGVAHDLDDSPIDDAAGPRPGAGAGAGVRAGNGAAAASRGGAAAALRSGSETNGDDAAETPEQGSNPAENAVRSDATTNVSALQTGSSPTHSKRAHTSAVAGAAAGSGSSGAGPADRGSRSSSLKPLPLIIGVLAVLVAIGLIIGLFVRPGDDPTAGETTAPPAEPSSAEPSPTEEAGPPPVIAAAEALDPEGDGSENDADAENVLPGVSGVWETDRYNSAEFGNLKSGLGLGLELEDEATISSVAIISGTPGGAVEIRVGDSADPEDAETVATGELPDDTGTIELDEPATGTHVFVWITELPSVSEGYRARISEIELS